jgi:hypothetical protein
VYLRKVTKYGCTVRPEPAESHLSSSHLGKSRKMSSPGSTTWSTGSVYYRGRKWWRYTWRDRHHTWRLLGRSSLKEVVMPQAPSPATAAQRALYYVTTSHGSFEASDSPPGGVIRVYRLSGRSEGLPTGVRRPEEQILDVEENIYIQIIRAVICEVTY